MFEKILMNVQKIRKPDLPGIQLMSLVGGLLLLARASPGPASLAWSAWLWARLRFICGAKAYRASKNVN